MKISKEPLFPALFGSKLKRRILKFLVWNDSPATEREIARLLGVSNTAVNHTMKSLQTLNAVKYTVIGKSVIWKINEKSFTYPLIQKFLEMNELTPLEFVKTEIAGVIKTYIERINQVNKGKNPKVLGAYIFGSVAAGTAREESDIDILIILEKVSQSDEEIRFVFRDLVLEDLLEKTGNAPSYHFYSKEALDTNKPSWLKSAVEKGIKVYDVTDQNGA